MSPAFTKIRNFNGFLGRHFGWSGLCDFYDEGGCVVATTFFHCLFDQALSYFRARLAGFWFFSQDFYDVVIVKALDQAVGAQQENVASFVADGAELGVDELVAAAERLLQYSSSWMCPGFPFADLAVAQ